MLPVAVQVNLEAHTRTQSPRDKLQKGKSSKISALLLPVLLADSAGCLTRPPARRALARSIQYCLNKHSCLIELFFAKNLPN